MKSKRLTLSVLFVVAAVANALACTNLIVGKNASADGSTIVSYSADSYGLFGELYHYSAGMHKKGTLIDIHEWDTGKYLGQIEQARQTYNVIGNMNEFQLTIGETTFGGRPELVDTTGIIDYGSLIYLGLQRSRTAREAIKVMTELVQEYVHIADDIVRLTRLHQSYRGQERFCGWFYHCFLFCRFLWFVRRVVSLFCRYAQERYAD